LNDPQAQNAIIAKDIGAGVNGLAVDSDTGLVYVTTSNNRVAVYDTSNWTPEQGQSISPTDYETDGVQGPAGICTAGDVAYKTDAFSIVKEVSEPNGCVSPFYDFLDNYVVYEINWDANGVEDSNVVIVDFLPRQVNEPNFISDAGVYDSNTHSVKWIIGNVTGNESGTYYIQVGVNKWARPGRTITNKVKMEGDDYLSWHIIDTDVCQWGPPIIYVDKDATNGYKNGTNWDDAYTNLRAAFAAAQNLGSDVNAIWVAEGIYTPVNDVTVDNYQDYNFVLLEGVGLFGHFGGIGTYETNISQRNFADANNETILEGQIGLNYTNAVYKVVTAAYIEDAIIDGFTAKGSLGGAGVDVNDSNVSIVNCKFMNNYYGYGVHIYNYSYPDIHNCVFFNNDNAGIKTSNYSGPTVTSCNFDGNYNTSYGIVVSYSDVVVEKTKFTNHYTSGIHVSYGDLAITDCNFINDRNKSLNISDSNATITNCSIRDCWNGNSIYAERSNLIVVHTLISNSHDNALIASDCNLTLTNSILRYSGECGIVLEDVSSTTIRNNTIKNNWIHDNGTDKFANYRSGILLTDQVDIPLIRNNTIFDNNSFGIQSTEQGADPNILNCIIYDNNSGDLYRENGTFNTVNYCNLQDQHSGKGNITGDPGFMNVDIDHNDLHIDGTSQCKDAGDPNVDYGDETDIDGEDRVKYDRVDIGADEYYWPKADYDRDEIVNFLDYSDLAKFWLESNVDISLDTDPNVNIYDLALFCEDWLWMAPWGKGFSFFCMGGGYGMYMSKSSSGSGGLMIPDVVASLEAMPDSMFAKVEKFYSVTPASQPVYMSAQQKAASVSEILEWLDVSWEKGDIKDYLTYKEYLEFRESIKMLAENEF